MSTATPETPSLGTVAPSAMSSPFKIFAGPNNPYGYSQGQEIPGGNSDSIVAVPIWDGTPLQSGQNSNINIVGFMQLFIQSEGNPQGTVYGTIMNVTACGGGGNGPGGNPGPIVAPGGSAIPVRLIHE